MSELYHYGVKRKSGRYPWGSGKRPFQSSGGPSWDKYTPYKNKLWRVTAKKYQNADGTLSDLGKKRLEKIKEKESKRLTNDSSRVGDYEIKKGTKLYRTDIPGEKNSSRAYASLTELDRKRQAVARPNQNEITLKAIKDIKVAGEKAQIESFLDVIGKTSLKDVVSSVKVYDPDSKFPGIHERSKQRRDNAEMMLVDMVRSGKIKEAKEFFEERIAKDDEVTKEYFNSLKTKGYQACIDFADKYGDLPLIVFDRAEDLKETKSRKIGERELDKYREYVNTVGDNQRRNKRR